MLMRYGWKGGNLAALYKVILTINHYRKNLTVTEQSLKDFCNYGNKILEFARFLMFQNFKDKPVCIFNFNTTEKLWYCIRSIDILEKIYVATEKHPQHYLFKNHKEYVKNLRMIVDSEELVKNWSHKDDFILISWVLNHGFSNYSKISNANRWLKTNPRVDKVAQEKKLYDKPEVLIRMFDYKMPWESLYERVYKFDIVNERRNVFKKTEVKEKMRALKRKLEKFLESRIDFLIEFENKLDLWIL